MLHFGLPVAPMTLNNVFNAGKDEDDLPDAEADLPRVQRIMFAEKPLEFLDLYHQRSYGFPMLRRPQSKVNQASQLTTPCAQTQTTATEKKLLTGKHLPLPIFPPQSTVVMRGDAGDPVNVYGLNGYGVQITDEREASEGEFLNAALSIIRLPKNTKTYAFTVDQYRNQEKNKDEPEKEFVKSFPVDQDSFSHVYNQYLKARLYNRQRDWPMVVRKTIDEKTSTFQIPAKLKKPPAARPLRNINSGNSTTQTGPILPPPNTSPTKKPPPSPPKDSGKLSPNKKDPPLPPTGPNVPHPAGGLPGGSTTAANPGPNERVVYSLNGNRSAVFTNDHRSFYLAALKVVNQGGAGQGKVNFTVSQYNNAPARQAPDGKFAYVGSEEFLEGSDNLPQYRNSVANVMFKPMAAANCHEDWRIVAHTTAPHVVQNWPLTSASDEMVEVFVYYKINRPTGGAPSGAGAGGGAGTVGEAGTGGGAGAGEGSGGGPLTGAGPKPPITEPSPAIKGGYIHGFGGRLNIQNTAADFQRGALQLLGIDPASAFLFYVSSPGSNLPKTVMVTQQTYSQKFESDIRPLLPGAGNWNIFVSKYRLSTEPPLEPEQEKRDIARITYGHNIAYWKIPTNTTAEYGLNQLQEEYVRAIRVLFPSGAAGVVHIGAEKSGAIDLGYGGLELTRLLWERVTSDLNSQSSALVYILTLTPNDHQDTIGVRMIGCVTAGHARATDYVQIHREIMGLQQFVQNGSPPKQFRLWKTAEDREKNGKSVLINYEPEATAVQEIEKFLNQQPGTETNCIWFRPEFGTFHFTDYGKLMNGAKIDVTGATLTDSISALQNLYHKANPQELFNKADPEAREDIVLLDLHSDSRFVLSEDTTACQFRKYVSDWFTGEEIYVQQNVKVGYRKFPVVFCSNFANVCSEVEQIPPWGLLEASPVASTPEIQNKPTQTQSNQPPITGPIFPPPVPPYQHPLTGRINKDRIIKPRVSTPKPVTWAVWQAESNRQDRLQRDSYHRDQSVIEPGQQPAPPIFGPSRQTPLSTGSSMSLPEPYFIAMTPSDYARKAEENQALRNSCLERMSRCQLCDTSFPEYETDKIAEHLKSHIDALRQAGKCPLCACCWAALDMQQKKEHLWGHQKQCESDHMRNFWQGFQCPICDEELLALASTDDVLAHMADHPPGLLRFCDRCGLDSTVCSLAHKKHHDQTCLETDQTGKLSFCNRCGKERSSETEQDRKTHELTCKPNGSVFCKICGLSLSSMRDNQKHEHSLIHKAPGGPRKTFCKRCGKNLVTMSAEEKATHKQDCYLTLPRTFDTRERIQGKYCQTRSFGLTNLPCCRTRKSHKRSKKIDCAKSCSRCAPSSKKI
ncbi:hypothetical protein L207DRAFT_146337 [Hyaloscypha variabilis F]|uniref:C2H2-type domain-containing protein n=1 Tax=Hyaloscypha variabilis (strain UAMH 11265 / GT02V1 / F) TaxID=1149755 RepID=A0A2J6R5J5_HYAVF|nr:hypothetical protein L207DRAFT_146337 [Hyaloscypha variabilis F]